MVTFVYRGQELRKGPNAWRREKIQAPRLYTRLNTTCGQELSTARSPHELVTAIVHAMIGHFSSEESRWLHRDISSRNIQIIKPEARIPSSKFDVTNDMTQCCGVLTDGDLVKMYLPEGTGSRTDKEVSGTLPFMSIKVLQTFSYNLVHHRTPEDDLESFFWVLVWEYLQKVHEYHRYNLQEQYFLEKFLSSNHKYVLTGKNIVKKAVPGTAQERIGCSLLPLLQRWLTLTCGDMSFDTMFVELIKTANQELGNAVDWDSWDNFFVSRKSNQDSMDMDE